MAKSDDLYKLYLATLITKSISMVDLPTRIVAKIIESREIWDSGIEHI